MLELPHNVCMLMISMTLLASSYFIARMSPETRSSNLEMWHFFASFFIFVAGIAFLAAASITTFSPRGL